MYARWKTCSKLNEISANEIKSIVIGTHASALPKKTLEEEPYTYVCQGEGPITVIELINFLKGKHKDLKKSQDFGILTKIKKLIQTLQQKCLKI